MYLWYVSPLCSGTLSFRHVHLRAIAWNRGWLVRDQMVIHVDDIHVGRAFLVARLEAIERLVDLSEPQVDKGEPIR